MTSLANFTRKVPAPLSKQTVPNNGPAAGKEIKMPSSPNKPVSDIFQNNLRQESTEQLLQVWTENDRNYQPDELAVVLRLLFERGVEIPMPGEAKSDEIDEIFSLPTESNAKLRELKPGKVEIHFSKNGYLRPGRFEFKDDDDLLSYLHQSFKGSIEKQGIRGSITRRGKYQRLDENDNPIFTFGDPILDSITNRHGLLILSGEVHNLRAAAIDSKERHGGIHSVDLIPYLDDIRKVQIARAALGEGNFVLLDSDSEAVTLTSSNPSTLDFWRDHSHMRFRAWRTTLWLYWSMGGEIETWGRDFDRASLFGQYGDKMGGSWCIFWYHDYDSDSDDDYVDEWEWGIFSRPFDGVTSQCWASWAGSSNTGTVAKGNCANLNWI